jgi:hypothetical protein
MPTGPVVEYLARSLSAFYALVGALCLVVAAALERYRPLVRFLGVAFALMSLSSSASIWRWGCRGGGLPPRGQGAWCSG